MSVMTEVLNRVVAYAKETYPLYQVTTGALPANEGISMTYATGSVDTTFFGKHSRVETFPIVCNSKFMLQKTALEELDRIHAALTRKKVYARGMGWTIIDIATEGEPAYMGREDSGEWLYGSSLKIRVWRTD